MKANRRSEIYRSVLIFPYRLEILVVLILVTVEVFVSF